MERYSHGNCKQCKSPMFGRRRAFCNLKCRNDYHNDRRIKETPLVRNINVKLLRNRNILRLILNNQDAIRVSRADLDNRKFNFSYFTHTYTSKRGDTYLFCYDYGYLPLKNDHYIIVKADLKE